MRRSMLVSLSAVAVLLVYVFGFVGVNVHRCLCSGDVTVTLAIGHCDRGDCDCASGHHAVSCCSDTLLKLSLTGDDSSSDSTRLPAPAVAPALVSHIPALAATCVYCPDVFRDRVRPGGGDILTDICIMRV